MDWDIIKAFAVAWAGWGFGFASGIIIAVLVAIKEDIRDWYERRRSDND